MSAFFPLPHSLIFIPFRFLLMLCIFPSLLTFFPSFCAHGPDSAYPLVFLAPSHALFASMQRSMCCYKLASWQGRHITPSLSFSRRARLALSPAWQTFFVPLLSLPLFLSELDVGQWAQNIHGGY